MHVEAAETENVRFNYRPIVHTQADQRGGAFSPRYLLEGGTFSNCILHIIFVVLQTFLEQYLSSMDTVEP